MAEFTVEAIVLRRWPAGENDRSLALLTREHGKIYVHAKGARKSGSRLAGASEPLIHATFHLATGRVRQFVKQVQPHSSFPGLRADYDRLTVCLGLAEVAASALPEEAPSEEAFQVVQKALELVSQREGWVPVLVWAESRLLQEQGLWPDWTVCAASDKRIDTDPAYVSPLAGGAVAYQEARDFPDAFAVPWAALVGLKRIVEREDPPNTMQAAARAYQVLDAFWRHVLEAPLPAHREAMRTVNQANV